MPRQDRVVTEFDPDDPGGETLARWKWNEQVREEQCSSCEYDRDGGCPPCAYDDGHWRG